MSTDQQNSLIAHLKNSLDSGKQCRIMNRELSIMFPPVTESDFAIRNRIITSSEDVFKRWCLEHKYFYKYDFSNDSYLVQK